MSQRRGTGVIAPVSESWRRQSVAGTSRRPGRRARPRIGAGRNRAGESATERPTSPASRRQRRSGPKPRSAARRRGTTTNPCRPRVSRGPRPSPDHPPSPAPACRRCPRQGGVFAPCPSRWRRGGGTSGRMRGEPAGRAPQGGSRSGVLAAPPERHSDGAWGFLPEARNPLRGKAWRSSVPRFASGQGASCRDRPRIPGSRFRTLAKKRRLRGLRHDALSARTRLSRPVKTKLR